MVLAPLAASHRNQRVVSNNTGGCKHENLAGRSEAGNRLQAEDNPEGHGAAPPWPTHDLTPDAEAAGGLLVAEIHTKVKDHEWQLMDAFIGYLDRHLGEQIESISIYYR